MSALSSQKQKSPTNWSLYWNWDTSFVTQTSVFYQCFLVFDIIGYFQIYVLSILTSLF